jgi:hypothetical protein
VGWTALHVAAHVAACFEAVKEQLKRPCHHTLTCIICTCRSKERDSLITGLLLDR